METPVIFEFPFRVAPADIDRMGHVNNVVYLRYAQDAAVAHWRAAVSEELSRGTAWVVRRHEIDYLRPAFEGDELVSKTWVGTADGATFERFVEITRPKDACVLARVRTVWVALDPKSQRPKRVTPDLLAPFRE
ncbi:MAG: thioesterase family protein [Isosphaeraceae bacterium]